MTPAGELSKRATSNAGIDPNAIKARDRHERSCSTLWRCSLEPSEGVRRREHRHGIDGSASPSHASIGLVGGRDDQTRNAGAIHAPRASGRAVVVLRALWFRRLRPGLRLGRLRSNRDGLGYRGLRACDHHARTGRRVLGALNLVAVEAELARHVPALPQAVRAVNVEATGAHDARVRELGRAAKRHCYNQTHAPRLSHRGIHRRGASGRQEWSSSSRNLPILSQLLTESLAGHARCTNWRYSEDGSVTSCLQS